MCTCDCGRQQQCISDRSICFKAINREILYCTWKYTITLKLLKASHLYIHSKQVIMNWTCSELLLVGWSLCPTRDPGKYRCTYPHLWKGIIFKNCRLRGYKLGAMFCSSSVPWNCWKLTSKPCYPSIPIPISHPYLDPYHVFRVLARLQHVPVRK